METNRGMRKTMTGEVVSDKMDKTVVVQITRRHLHPLFKKYITRTFRYKAHDETNSCGVGDKVELVESRPLSHDKRWRVKKIVEKAV
jgi:small subunit ribosomal protein S17